MAILRTIVAGLRNLLLRTRTAHDVDEELRSYYESAVEQGLRNGLPRAEAERAAKVHLGSVDAARERIAAVGWENRIEAVAQDARFARRMMRKSPVTSAVIILTLALGIGATSGMFGIVYGILVRPLPFPDEDRIAVVHMHFAPQNNPRGNMSLADFADWRANNKSFDKVAAYSPSRFVLTGGDRAEEVVGASVTADYFSVLGVQPIAGRLFAADEDSGGAAPLLVISKTLWERRFHADATIIGRPIEVNGKTATVIGIVAGSDGFPRANVDLWRNQPVAPTRRGPFFFHGIGRLRDGATLQQAQAELNTLGASIEHRFPDNYSHLTMPVEPLHEFLVGRIRPAMLMIFAAVALVLLIALVNIANLLLARATAREREIAARLSLGATRGRIVQQMLTETVLLAAIGGALGIAVAYFIVGAFRASNPLNSPLAYRATVDWHVLGITALLSLACGIAFGVFPAMQSARAEVNTGLRESGLQRTASMRHKRLRTILVTAEIALSLVLLLGGGLLMRSFMRLQQAGTGIGQAPSQLLSMSITPGQRANGGRERTAEDWAPYFQRIEDEVSSIPGVKSVTISDALPPMYLTDDDTFRIAGKPWSEQAFPSTALATISPEYFRTLGVPLIRGRFFTASDGPKNEPVTIISESLARKYFADADPLGQKIAASGPGTNTPWMTIVGVVGDLKYWGTESDFSPTYYVPLLQNGASPAWVIVHAQNTSSLAPAIEQRLRSLDKDIVVRRELTLEDVLDEAVAQPRLRASLLAGFAVLALVLASIGVYAVIAYAVEQRTAEIGIRMALGAQRSNVVTMILWNSVVVSCGGVAIGLLASAAAAGVVSPFLYETRVWDPLTLAVCCATLLAFTVAAALVPALRATRIDPVIALRQS